MILDMKALSRESAAKALNMSLSMLDTIVAKSRNGTAIVPLRFYQVRRRAPMWFPVPWLMEWIEEVGRRGAAINEKRRIAG